MIDQKKYIEYILERVTDPEMPVISVMDLGIVREVKIDGQQVEVIITPTYSGCPAMLEIEKNINNVLKQEGFKTIKVSTVLSPAWTTDWMSDEGKRKLEKYGIAPPDPASPENIKCPLCESGNTELVSQFGSTSCRSMYKCNDCLEPFDYFKCH